MSISPKARRTIFAVSRELGLDDDARRDLQQQVTGKSSTSTMTPLEGARMIDHLRKLRGPGRRFPQRAGRVPSTLKRKPLLQKIEALLADMQLPWEYAESIAWRITGGTGKNRRDGTQVPGVERMEWVRSDRHLRAVIAALHVEQDRRALLANVEELMAKLDKAIPNWRVDLEVLPKGWERHRPTLNQLRITLSARLDFAYLEGDLP